MEVLWNQINLQPPPFRPWDISITEFDPKQFLRAIDVILNDFKTFNVLHTEAALLSRLIYRMKSKFRSDKGLKHMEKVNRALLNYLNMSLHKEYELLKEYTEVNNGIVSLPSRQTLEYVLVRTQGFAKVMCRIEAMALTAVSILQSRLYIGQAWSVAMIALAIISRIWVLSKCILKRSCIWYSIIYKFTKSFKVVGISWLPDNCILPTSLSKWLDLPRSNENLEKTFEQVNLDTSISSLIKESDKAELITNDIDSAINEALENVIQKTAKPHHSLISEEKADNEDFGRSISREMFEKKRKSTAEENKKVKKKKIIDNDKKNEKPALNIKSETDLVRFLTADSFSGLDKLQWNILKKKTKKFLLKLTKNNTCDVDAKVCKKVTKLVQNWINSR